MIVVPEDESTPLARWRRTDIPSSPAPRTKMEALFISSVQRKIVRTRVLINKLRLGRDRSIDARSDLYSPGMTL